MTYRSQHASLVTALVLAMLAPACGANVVTASTGGAGGTGATSSSGGYAPPPDAVPPDGTGSAVFAISKLLIGDTDRDGTPNQANGWKQYGADLDGRASTAASTDLCKPAGGGAPKTAYPDGNGGIDNAFGKNILPILLGLQSDASTSINAFINAGHGTTLFALEKLGQGPSYAPLAARTYIARDRGAAPQWNGLDGWPVAFESLADPADVSSATLHVTDSYTDQNRWVSAGWGELPLTLRLGSFALALRIRRAVITMEISPDRQSATGGTISGVISTSAFVAAIQEAAANFDPSLCVGPTIDSVTSQLEQASDILVDGTQDPTKTCDAISIGLGFEARAAQLGSVAEPVPPPPQPCSPSP